MIHYDNNCQIVIQTLQKYGYSQRTIYLDEECFSQLKKWFLRHEILSFSGELAFAWVESEEVISRRKKTFRAAIRKLADVYVTGSVVRTHLIFYGRSLPAAFADVKAGYIASLTGKYSSRHICNMQDACNRFLGFLYVNGIESPNAISYSILDMYVQDIEQIKRGSGMEEGFLFYLAEQGACSYGLGWYMHFAQLGKHPVDNNFSLAQVTILAAGGGNNGYSAEYVRQSIPAFLDKLKDFHYSQIVINTSEATLSLLYLLLEMSGALYSRIIADTWISDTGRRLFKSSFVMARRALELYDDFITTGNLDPFKRWKHVPSALESLPEWCYKEVNLFLEQKRREGRRKSTVSNYGYAVTQFCQFLANKGLDSFQTITPELLKEFNAQDVSKTIAVKAGYHRMVRKFLIFLFREKLHPQADLYLSLPVGAVLGERIVTVLTDREKDQFKCYKGTNASPLALRDVAIIELGLKMGFRSCDIANLQLSDIDWKTRTICLIQKKTGVAVRLPMPNSVGNAIYKYLKDGRPPDTKYTHVFLKTRAPYGPICLAECRQAIGRALPGTTGTKFHVTRRTFATELLRNSAQIPVIADLLGHSSITNVHKYLLLDEEKMRLCPLSLEETGLLMQRGASDE